MTGFTCQVTAASLREVLRPHLHWSSQEEELQLGVSQQLDAMGVQFCREARLASPDRIDFLVGEVGVEVKVNGSVTAQGPVGSPCGRERKG